MSNRESITTGSARQRTKSPGSFKVAYLRRTARDFLESQEITQRILRMSNDDFNPRTSLLRSSILILKTWADHKLPYELSRTAFLDCIDLCMKNAAVVEKDTHIPPVELLEEIDLAASGIVVSAGIRHQNTGQRSTQGQTGRPDSRSCSEIKSSRVHSEQYRERRNYISNPGGPSYSGLHRHRLLQLSISE